MFHVSWPQERSGPLKNGVNGTETGRATAPPEAKRSFWNLSQQAESAVARFLRLSAAGGIILLVVTVIAMLWANMSPESYEAIWKTPITFGVGRWSVHPTLHFLVNEGWMTIFFLIVGTEIKREVVEGELSTVRRAMLPVAAAFGGMIAPALLYFAVNPTAPNLRGFGIPMATDIAFAVGVLALLGDRVPAALRIFLLTFAVADDLGAILVINVFYSGSLHALPLFVGVGGAVAIVYIVRWFGLRSGWWYAIPLIIAWVGLHEAGLHPTLAGVLVGLLIPSKSWMPFEKVRDLLNHFHVRLKTAGKVSDKEIAEDAGHAMAVISNGLSPLTRIETAWHGPVVFIILPIFALANAGVSLHGLNLAAHGAAGTALGVTLGLVVGKPVGICLIVYMMTKLKIITLPIALDQRGILLAGMLGGIGFTMANFTAALAFASPEDAGLLAAAKLGILCGSAISGTAGYFLGPRLLPSVIPSNAAKTVKEAEGRDDA